MKAENPIKISMEEKYKTTFVMFRTALTKSFWIFAERLGSEEAFKILPEITQAMAKAVGEHLAKIGKLDDSEEACLYLIDLYIHDVFGGEKCYINEDECRKLSYIQPECIYWERFFKQAKIDCSMNCSKEHTSLISAITKDFKAIVKKTFFRGDDICEIVIEINDRVES